MLHSGCETNFQYILFHLSFFLFCGAELDGLEADMGFETEGDGVPSYLQPDKEPDMEGELNLPSAPSGHTAVPAGRGNHQVNIHVRCHSSVKSLPLNP